MNVYILATCRNPDLMRATTMVFDTLRTGFPTAKVRVFTNRLEGLAREKVAEGIKAVGGEAEPVDTIHHEWVEDLILSCREPFVLCDTDMVFWKSVEDWKFKAPLAGRLLPQFFDSFTKCVTRPRLHTSLLFVDPAAARAARERYFDQFPKTVFNSPANLFYPMFAPARLADGMVVNYFHDTACLLYQAIGGQAFSELQLDHYDHLHCGTISDIVSPGLKAASLREVHFAIFENLALAKGIWKDQERYYKKFAA